jgi:sterol desaturase/sphingolipid hydroxylase (fatty acid hydroxylase superfamily)
MVNLIFNAIPFFVLLLALEAVTFHLARDHDHEHGKDYVGYDTRDSATSVSMGLGSVFINIGWKVVVVATYAALYELTPVRLPTDAWWVFVLLFFADDLSYYWYHRGGHRVRLLWASHVVHHSSEHYNLSTALRQTWTPMGGIVFWAWMPLVGFTPWMILLAQSWNLLYQFWIHTERIGRMPRWFEAVFNTPSHHRVHHGSQEQYLDKNYGGILIVWDRLFGTFEPEGERVRYGLTTNIGTYNLVTVAFHEYRAIVQDLRAAEGWRARLGYLLGPPGWAPQAANVRPAALEGGSDARSPAGAAAAPAADAVRA